MRETKKRKMHPPQCKAELGFAGMRSGKTINQIAKEFHVNPMPVGLWKKADQERVKTLFEAKRGPKAIDTNSEPDRVHSAIGRLKMALDWLKKKVRDEPLIKRQDWIDMKDDLAATCFIGAMRERMSNVSRWSSDLPADVADGARID